MLKQLEQHWPPSPDAAAAVAMGDIEIGRIVIRSVAENLTDAAIAAAAAAMQEADGDVAPDSRIAPVSADAEYEQFLADVWVGVVLTLMVLSCVCCMCSCLLYHKFQQWKRSVIESREVADMESARHDIESLPSYTIASGLPSYEEALAQLRTVKETITRSADGKLQPPQEVVIWLPASSGAATSRPRIASLTVTDIFQIYRRNSLNSVQNAEGPKSPS